MAPWWGGEVERWQECHTRGVCKLPRRKGCPTGCLRPRVDCRDTALELASSLNWRGPARRADLYTYRSTWSKDTWVARVRPG